MFFAEARHEAKRLEEFVAEVDRGLDRGPGHNPWQRCWIVAV
jgi:hypothetical protein